MLTWFLETELLAYFTNLGNWKRKAHPHAHTIPKAAETGSMAPNYRYAAVRWHISLEEVRWHGMTRNEELEQLV